MDKEEIIFSLEMKIWKQVWKLNQTFLREKLSLCSNDIPTFWLLINLYNMPNGLVTYNSNVSSYVYICCTSH